MALTSRVTTSRHCAARVLPPRPSSAVIRAASSDRAARRRRRCNQARRRRRRCNFDGGLRRGSAESDTAAIAHGLRARRVHVRRCRDVSLLSADVGGGHRSLSAAGGTPGPSRRHTGPRYAREECKASVGPIDLRVLVVACCGLSFMFGMLCSSVVHA